MLYPYATKILKQENGVTFEAVTDYGNLVRDLPCVYVDRDGLKGCIVRKKRLHHTVGDDTSIDIYAMDVGYGLIEPIEFTKSGALWRNGDFFFQTPAYMVQQLIRINDQEATIELTLHALDKISYNMTRFRNRTLIHRDALIQRFHLDGITRVVFR